MTYLEKALKDGHAEIVGDVKQQKILYKAVDHSERYSDPEGANGEFGKNPPLCAKT